MQLATKFISRELAVAGGAITVMLEAGQYWPAAAVAVGYALGMGLQKAAEALGISRYLGNVKDGLDEAFEAANEPD